MYGVAVRQAEILRSRSLWNPSTFQPANLRNVTPRRRWQRRSKNQSLSPDLKPGGMTGVNNAMTAQPEASSNLRRKHGIDTGCLGRRVSCLRRCRFFSFLHDRNDKHDATSNQLVWLSPPVYPSSRGVTATVLTLESVLWSSPLLFLGI